MSNDSIVVGDPAWLYANREAIKAGVEEEIMEAMEELKVAAQQLEESDKELAKVVEGLEWISYERRQYEAELIRLIRKGTLIL